VKLEAQVTRIVDARTFVSVGGQGGCGRCEEVGGCRSDVLGQMFGSRCREYEVENLPGAQPGSLVSVDIPDGAPLRAAMLAYVFPLCMVLLAAALAHWSGGSELLVIVSSAAALVCSILLLRSPRVSILLRGMRPRLVDILEP
jgi:sigma-E factor negative regulatory protein RseC